MFLTRDVEWRNRIVSAFREAGLAEGRDTLADIKPSFKDDTNIVPTPPREPTFSDCEKVVERDVEVYRKEAPVHRHALRRRLG